MMKLTAGFWCIWVIFMISVEWSSFGSLCVFEWNLQCTLVANMTQPKVVSNEAAARLRWKSWHGTVHKSVPLSLPTDLIGALIVCPWPICKRADFQLQMLHFMHKSTCHVQNLELLTCAWSWHPGHGHDPRRLCVERQRDDAKYQLSRYWYHSSLGQRSFVWWWCLWNQRLCRKWLQEIISEQCRIWVSADFL